MSVDRQRAGRRARKRGARGELEVRDLLREHGWTGTHRNFQSGGQGGADLADSIPDTHIEVKFTERLDLPAAWRQAQAGARPTDLVLVAHRASGQSWLGSLDLLDLMELLVGVTPWFRVVGPRASVRAEFFGLVREPGPGLRVVVHQVGSLAMGTLALSDLLVLLARARGAA